MKECPKCGDKGGYYYYKKATVLISGPWGEEAEIAKIIDNGLLPKYVKCAWCEKKINRIKAGDKRKNK